MSNAARIDERWDSPYAPEFRDPFLQTNVAHESFLSTRWLPKASEITEIDFLGERIAWTRDGNRPFPKQVADVLDEITRFSALDRGWDSYNGRATVRAAIRPALQLLFELYNRRSQHPYAVPLSKGGIGLHWKSETFELEIDVWSESDCEALLTDRTTQEEYEVESSTREGLKPVLDRFLSHP